MSEEITLEPRIVKIEEVEITWDWIKPFLPALAKDITYRIWNWLRREKTPAPIYHPIGYLRGTTLYLATELDKWETHLTIQYQGPDDKLHVIKMSIDDADVLEGALQSQLRKAGRRPG